jgi:hypothetical protein
MSTTAERTVHGWTRAEVYAAAEKRIEQGLRRMAAQNLPAELRTLVAGELLTEGDIEELAAYSLRLGAGEHTSVYNERRREAQAFVSREGPKRHIREIREIREGLHEFDLDEDDEDYLVALAKELQRSGAMSSAVIPQRSRTERK